ncbi:hypothetical protein [Sphingomonas xinjiangensis]|uniref:Uncharacterized protein n=1 Tax=Sphingomonas xinjiangensis TaxID=643568 RepID=A0A840YK99_9SPHN|nr:hypothetical protein [Sphingomonas xinjiangensis]MBB5709516.1 hypothetical protein [Sphingomonas xinjiangensis]
MKRVGEARVEANRAGSEDVGRDGDDRGVGGKRPRGVSMRRTLALPLICVTGVPSTTRAPAAWRAISAP